MGRYSTEPQIIQNQQQIPISNWPVEFPKPVVGLDLHGTIIEFNANINDPSQVVPIPGALEAIKLLRIKGHKVFILADYPGISAKKLTQMDVESIHMRLFELLGQSGCMSLDGLLYNTSAKKNDIFAKPNTGMMKRATNEFKMNWKEGWYVGDDIVDLKMAEKGGSKPILVLTGKGNETLPKLDSFANKELKKKVKIFPNLLSFAQSL